MAVVSSRIVQSRRWMVLPDGWDTGWKAARAASGSAPAYVTVIGDSNAVGYGSTDGFNKSWARLIRNALVTKYGLYGDYWPVSGAARYNVAMGGTAIPGTSPYTFDTTFGSAGMVSNGFVSTMFQENGGTYPVAWVNAGSGSFVTPYACTDFDFIAHDYTASATWKYNIDNAAGTGLVTVTTDGRNSMRRIPVTGQTNAVHTVRVGNPSSAFALGLNGIVTYDPTNAKTRGIGFANASSVGIKMMDWHQSWNQNPPDRMHQLQGRYKTAAATEVMTGFGFPTQPHLAIIELGINDCQATEGVVQYRLAMRRMCDAIRRGRDNASILFVICPNPTIQGTDHTAQFTRAESWPLYADQIYAVAAEYQCAVFNVHADWMSTPVAQGYTVAGDPHPTDAGHQNMADALIPVIV